MEATIVEPRRGRDVGRILVPLRVENLGDLELVARGVLSPDQVRSLELIALLDTGVTYLSLPASEVAQLGLRHVLSKTARTAAGLVEQKIFSPVRVTVEDRYAVSEVAELPNGSPPLLG